MAEPAVCDRCGGTESVESVTVSWRGRSFIIDICANEEALFLELEEQGSSKPRARQENHGKPTPHKVIPID